MGAEIGPGFNENPENARLPEVFTPASSGVNLSETPLQAQAVAILVGITIWIPHYGYYNGSE